MADRLTQLQDCLDDLATQMFATVRYIQKRHSHSPIQGQPDMGPEPSSTITFTTTSQSQSQPQQADPDQQQQQSEETSIPDPPEIFDQSLRELSRDLVLKEQQIEYLISVLPGIGSSEASQNARIKALELELREADLRRGEAVERRERMLDTLSSLAAQCKRVY